MRINKKLRYNHDFYRASLLIQKAVDLDMDLSGYGELTLNENSGNVYLILEDYLFALFVPLHGDKVKAYWEDEDTGEEHVIEVTKQSLTDLQEWAEELEKQSEVSNASN